MNAVNTKNGRDSAPMSRSVPPHRDNEANDDYLARQAREAREALQAALDDLSGDVADAAQLSRWIRRYPWPAMGAALVAGFTSASLVFPADRDQEPVEPSPPADESQPAPQRGAGSAPRSALLQYLFDLLRTAVTQVVTAYAYRASANVTSGINPEREHAPVDPEFTP